jgi:FKBP-type peptidyl-prolyl cis-trans isomerase FkpA
MRSLLTGIIALSFVLSSCVKESNTGCSFDACATVAPASEIQAVQNYLTTNSLTATQHCSGLFYRIENAGSGTTPKACSNVSVKYKAYFISGTVFDQQTTAVALSLGNTIRGWRCAVPLIKASGRIVLYIPPSLAYGSQDLRDQSGNIVIPANSILIFEIDLVSVN